MGLVVSAVFLCFGVAWLLHRLEATEPQATCVAEPTVACLADHAERLALADRAVGDLAQLGRIDAAHRIAPHGALRNGRAEAEAEAQADDRTAAHRIETLTAGLGDPQAAAHVMDSIADARFVWSEVLTETLPTQTRLTLLPVAEAALASDGERLMLRMRLAESLSRPESPVIDRTAAMRLLDGVNDVPTLCARDARTILPPAITVAARLGRDDLVQRFLRDGIGHALESGDAQLVARMALLLAAHGRGCDRPQSDPGACRLADRP
ncbi:hypothetical protein C7455_101131 [Roseicyclus mahoneyensis]|uniref:Uncharacterized protein n=2 Tax=Roseicyclus mahoneyensis TaxID=164332 RepID=A0A316GM75_9RHOB|nr:hypothetical protein C7455_101131 [Roseicyclus mahoneyensis]